MRKETGIWSGGIVFFVLLLLSGAGAALAACGESPPAPEDAFVWPLAGDITRGWRLDCQTDRGHRGIDISAGPGKDISAVSSGSVSFVGYTPAEGGSTTITIDHPGGLRSTYLHVADPEVAKGQPVAAGDVIAVSTETPLHLGIKLAGTGHDTYFDPLQFLPVMPPEPDLPSQPQAETPAQIAPQPMPSPPAYPQQSPVAAPEPIAPLIVPAPSAADLPVITVEPSMAPAAAARAIESVIPSSHAASASVLARMETSRREKIFRDLSAGGSAARFLQAKPSDARASGEKIPASGSRPLAVAAGVLLLSLTATAGGRLAGGWAGRGFWTGRRELLV